MTTRQIVKLQYYLTQIERWICCGHRWNRHQQRRLARACHQYNNTLRRMGFRMLPTNGCGDIS
jgi:hypothetical protein